MNVAVIPAYNAGKTIRDVVERSRKFVDHIIVVDDCSTDNTLDEARRAGAEVVRHHKNMGKAAALKTGFKRVGNCEIVITMDADLQHIPEEIPALLDRVRDGCDLCVGSRLLSDVSRMPLLNRISNRLTSILITVLARQEITDPQSGFRAIKQEALQNLELPSERYAIEHIMILEAAKKGLKIEEVPISCVYGEETSHINPVKDTANVIYHILRFII